MAQAAAAAEGASVQPANVPQGPPVPDSDLAPVLAQLNLAAVKNRAIELYAAIGRLRDAFQPQYAGVLKWSDILNQFAVLNTQLLTLVADMKPILRMFVVYPKAGGVGAQTAPILPLMLSTKLLPEMDDERASLQNQLERDMAPAVSQQGGQPAQNSPPLQAPIARLQQQIDAIRTACDAASRSIQTGRRTLTQPATSAYQAPAKPDPALLQQEKLLRNAVLFGEGLRVPEGLRVTEGLASSGGSLSTRTLPPHLAKVMATPGGGSGPSSPRGGKPPLPQLRAGGSLFASPLSPPGGSGGKAPVFKAPSPRLPSPYAAASPKKPS